MNEPVWLATKRINIIAVPYQGRWNVCLVDPDDLTTLVVVGEPLNQRDAEKVGRWLAHAAVQIVDAMVPYLAINSHFVTVEPEG